MERTQLQEIVATLPMQPGVYRFKDAAGNILYIGKAINLRNRVRSYFADTALTPKIRNMVRQIADLEVTVVASELEALVLECNLIKHHQPKYNTRLKDDKHYPYIKVSLNEDFPQVTITRRYLDDGARYFGPFTDSRSVYSTLDLLNKLFRYRRCSIEITGTDPRGCLDFHIRRCLGPCMGKVDREEYRQAIDQVCLFLEGRHEEIIEGLNAEMAKAAEDLNFERAAYLRDQVAAIYSVTQRQKVITRTFEDEDVIAIARNEMEAAAEVFLIRGGKLIAGEHFFLENSQDEDIHTLMTTFVTQFYDSAPYVPPDIYVQYDLNEASVIESWLRSKRGAEVTIQVPRDGDKLDLIEMAAANATAALEEMRARWMADRLKRSTALDELAEHLDLPAPPNRIECYDISNIQGTSSVGSMVVFLDGQPDSASYRRFEIKTVQGADDFASMREVLRRRFKRAQSGVEGWLAPELVIVDGGKGQLNAAREVFTELEIEGVALASLAKEHEEIFVPNQSDSIMLPRTSQSLYLVQRIRDEAHRFALSYHQRLRSRRALTSQLDSVPGIGPKRKAALMRRFGSLAAIRAASIDDLAAVDGMNRSAAEKIKVGL